MRTPVIAGATNAAPVKLPEATLAFWIVKVLATTLGETGGDAVSMTLAWGYAAASVLFLFVFLVMVRLQMRTADFRPVQYWGAIVASTVLGTTLADFADRSLGIGYPGGVVLLTGLLGTCFWAWRSVLGTVDFRHVDTPRAEGFYWLAIMLSQTLGTALGDWAADSAGLGYTGGIALFGVALLAVALAWRTTQLSRTLLFWCAFVLTRPFGAVVGDFLDKPVDHGGLALGRFTASLVLCGLMVLLLWRFPQRAARSAH